MLEEYHPSLGTLVSQAKARKILLASVLAAYQQQHCLDDAQLAEYLLCTADNLIRLHLCDVPRPDHVAEDIQRIAHYVSADAVALEQVLKSSAQEARM